MPRKKGVAAELEPGATEFNPAELEGQQGQQPAEPTATAPEHAGEPSGNGHAAAQEKRNPIRGWTERYVHPVKYRRFTDDTLNAILFKFDLKPGEKLPPAEALDVMRAHKKDDLDQSTGLVFKDTRRHGPVWIVPNDPEGRELADRIDMELNKVAKKLEAEQGNSR